MLLFHDGLSHRSSSFLSARLATTGSPSFSQPHPKKGNACLSGTNFTISPPSLSYPRPSEAGVETCIVGAYLHLSAVPAVKAPLVVVKTASGSATQVTLFMVPKGTGIGLRAEVGNASFVLMDTDGVLPVGQWFYLEVLIRFSISQGKIVVRTDSAEVVRVENVTTEASSSDRYWDTVVIGGSTGPCVVSMADLYLCDARADHGKSFSTFLGPVLSDRIVATKAEGDWAPPAPLPGSKHRLIVLAGQSNQTGVGTTLPSAKWRSPNSKVRIWDRISGSPAFRPLEALVNTSGMFLIPPASHVWGPEMMFAEKIAKFFEDAGETAVPSVVMVKATQDGSFIYPYFYDYCWNPTLPNTLYNGTASPRGCLQVDMLNAVTALGGWGSVERVDFFWYQGEADSLYQVSALAYKSDLNLLFDTIALDIPVPHTFHVTRIHPRSNKGTGEGNGLWFLDEVRQAQLEVCRERTDCVMIESEGAELSPYGLHLTELGYDTLGDTYFESWKSQQSLHSMLSDYSTLTAVDDSYLAASAGTEILSPMSALRQGPLLSVTALFHGQASTSPTSLQLASSGRSMASTVPASGSWSQGSPMAAGIAIPEQVVSECSMSL